MVRDALTGARPTALTRAFTGRWARGIRNRFLDEHTATAPAAYPEIHHATSPLRKAARESGDSEAVNLWAGQAYQLAPERPAAEVVQRLVRDCRASLEAAAKRI
jgi:nitronate monooxygenase